MLAAWLTPPIVPIMKVYLFNITNPSQVRHESVSTWCIATTCVLQVLEGADPITEEIGPYAYSATHVRRIIEVRGL